MAGVSALHGLPRFIAFHGVRLDKYLRVVDEDGESHRFFQLSGDELVSPYTKFEYERSQSGGDDFVHIRSTYNGKYLGRRSINDNWIVGRDEPDEDRRIWSCTVFQRVASGSNNLYRFMHVPTGGFLATDSLFRPGHLYVRGSAHAEDFTIIDMDSFAVLPRHITFKGYNDLYLSSRVIEGYNYHQFASDDIYDPTIRFEAFTTRDGRVRIWSNHFKKFWRRSPNWIWADSDDTTTQNPDTLFWPIKLDGNVIALRNLGNNRICIALTADRKTDCLNAQVNDIDRLGRIHMEEVVSRRQIYDVTYRTEDARIYNFSNGNSLTRELNNRLSNPQRETVTFTFTRTVTNTWNMAHAWSTEVETTIQTGIPFLAEGKIKIGVSYSGDFSWGETKEESFQTSASLALEVPPRTRAFVTRIVTIGAIDIPFSYTQQDTLFNGNIVIRRFDDGIFTGVNTYVDFTTREEPL